MKKLVTIVSAVMMLLMLAACSNVTYTEEDLKNIGNGQAAYNALIEAAGEGKTENGVTTIDYTAEADEENGVKKGSTYTATVTVSEDKKTTTTEESGKATVTIGEGTDAVNVEIDFSKSITATEGETEEDYTGSVSGYFKVNGKDYSAIMLFAAN